MDTLTEMNRQIYWLLAITLICVSCSRTDDKPLAIKATQSPTGSVGPASVIARIDISRSSGFPRMARWGNEVHFAWTEFGKPSRVRTAVAEISNSQ